MAEYFLNVPLVSQMVAGEVMQKKYPDNVWRWTGENACWYAAACMVAYYYEHGPRYGLPKVWHANTSLFPQDFGALAKIEGLKAITKPITGLTSDALIQLLKAHGPLWAAGRYGGGGSGHAIVITGVKDEAVFYNDPWEPMAKTSTCEWIDSNLMVSHQALLARDPFAIKPPTELIKRYSA
jgi:Papain-like cysteine protease AvrRpt2